MRNLEKLVGAHILQRLMGPRRPRYLDDGGIGIAQPEVQPLVIRREIASRGGGKSGLPIHAYACSESVAIAACPAKRNREPMLLAAAIHQDERVPPENGQHRVHPAVIVQISKGQSAASDWDCNSRVSAFETAIMIQRQQRRF